MLPVIDVSSFQMQYAASRRDSSRIATDFGLYQGWCS